jgi:5'(3')-deoxyribonucleotidase
MSEIVKQTPNMNERKKIIYIDMDGVLVNFEQAIQNFFTNHPHLKERYRNNPDHIHGIFRNPPPVEGAIEAVKKLAESGKYELFIATAAPWGNPEAATDKRYWIEQYFGNLFHKKMFVTHRKDLLMGDYLIDDRIKNGAGEFSGELLRFGWAYEEEKWNEYPTWESILERLL